LFQWNEGKTARVQEKRKSDQSGGCDYIGDKGAIKGIAPAHRIRPLKKFQIHERKDLLRRRWPSPRNGSEWGEMLKVGKREHSRGPWEGVKKIFSTKRIAHPIQFSRRPLLYQTADSYKTRRKKRRFGTALALPSKRETPEPSVTPERGTKGSKHITLAKDQTMKIHHRAKPCFVNQQSGKSLTIKASKLRQSSLPATQSWGPCETNIITDKRGQKEKKEKSALFRVIRNIINSLGRSGNAKEKGRGRTDGFLLKTSTKDAGAS